jgi:hypothetical protein
MRMSNKAERIGYNIEDVENVMSGDSIAIGFSLPVKKIPVKEGISVMDKHKIMKSYNSIFIGLLLFVFISIVSLITGKGMGTFGAVLILVLSVTGIMAFFNDWKRWSES